MASSGPIQVSQAGCCVTEAASGLGLRPLSRVGGRHPVGGSGPLDLVVVVREDRQFRRPRRRPQRHRAQDREATLTPLSSEGSERSEAGRFDRGRGAGGREWLGNRPAQGAEKDVPRVIAAPVVDGGPGGESCWGLAMVGTRAGFCGCERSSVAFSAWRETPAESGAIQPKSLPNARSSLVLCSRAESGQRAGPARGAGEDGCELGAASGHWRSLWTMAPSARRVRDIRRRCSLGACPEMPER